MNLTWEYVDKINVEEMGKLIKEVERKYNILFPEDYKQCVLYYNAGYPKPNLYDYSDGEGIFEHLLSFTQELHITTVYEFISDQLPENIFPFATDPFGNFLCFDYRDSKISPSVVFCDHEEMDEENSISTICNSFSELLSCLHE